MRTISKESLMGRWYNYWVKKGGRPPGRDWEQKLARENLCHFVRTMVIWTPLRWFFLTRTKTVIAPWSVCLAIVCIIGLWLNPKITLTIMAALGGYAIIIGGAGLLFTKADDFLTTYIGRPIKKFFGWKIIGRLPYWPFLAAGLIGLGIYYVPKIMLAMAIMAAVFAGFAIAVGMIIGIGKILKYQPIQEIGSVAIEYIKAKKSKICPFLLVELE